MVNESWREKELNTHESNLFPNSSWSWSVTTTWSIFCQSDVPIQDFETAHTDTKRQGQLKSSLVMGDGSCNINIQFLEAARPEVPEKVLTLQGSPVFCSIISADHLAAALLPCSYLFLNLLLHNFLTYPISSQQILFLFKWARVSFCCIQLKTLTGIIAKILRDQKGAVRMK